MPPRAAHLRRLAALLALAVTLGLVAGCGGDDEGGDTGDKGQAQTEQTTEQAQQPATETEPGTETETEPPADAKDPEGAFLAFQNALANGDKEAVCGMLTPSAVKQAEEASIGGKCDTWVEEISKLYDEASKQKLKSTEVDSVDEQGDKATVKYTSPILNLPLEAELEKSGEGWKISKLAENV
ncbi:MAG TPA: hypothetical protein VF715_00480 [Thermoleophilaceae bacterium]